MLTKEANTYLTFDHDDIKRYVKEGRRLRSAMWIGVATRTTKRLRHVIGRCVGIPIRVACQAVSALVHIRRQHACVRALQGLNDRTLKDVGSHRSEIQSAVRELLDDAPPARVRGPARAARTGTIENAGATANDESFVEGISGRC